MLPFFYSRYLRIRKTARRYFFPFRWHVVKNPTNLMGDEKKEEMNAQIHSVAFIRS